MKMLKVKNTWGKTNTSLDFGSGGWCSVCLYGEGTLTSEPEIPPAKSSTETKIRANGSTCWTEKYLHLFLTGKVPVAEPRSLE